MMPAAMVKVLKLIALNMPTALPMPCQSQNIGFFRYLRCFSDRNVQSRTLSSVLAYILGDVTHRSISGLKGPLSKNEENQDIEF